MPLRGKETRTREGLQIVSYDPRWPSAFEAESVRIREALGPLALRIDHNGSTSVPGLAAKPVIDIQVSVRTLAFRDYLRDDSDEARRYEELKHEIAANLAPNNDDAREAYARAKTEYVERIVANALKAGYPRE